MQAGAIERAWPVGAHPTLVPGQSPATAAHHSRSPTNAGPPGFSRGKLGEVLSGIPSRLLQTRAWRISEERMGSQRPREGGFFVPFYFVTQVSEHTQGPKERTNPIYPFSRCDSVFPTRAV